MWKMIHHNIKYLAQRTSLVSGVKWNHCFNLGNLTPEPAFLKHCYTFPKKQVKVVKHLGILQRGRCQCRAHEHPQTPGGVYGLFRRAHTQGSVHGSLKWWIWVSGALQDSTWWTKAPLPCPVVTPVSLKGSLGGPLTSLGKVHKAKWRVQPLTKQ